MNLILIEESAYEQLKHRVRELTEMVGTLSTKLLHTESAEWLDSQEVCIALDISKRALQNYRNSGVIPYTFIGNKIYHKSSDIADILKSGLKRR